MLKWPIIFFDRLFSVAGAVTFSQIPEFIQQYSQQLSGHVNELNHQIGLMEKSAVLSNITLEEYIQKFLNFDNEAIFVRQGEIMKQMVVRLQDLSLALTQLKESPLYKKPLIFMAHIQTDIVKDTWDSFQPGIPTTLEGLIYALFGMLAGIFVFHIIKKTFKYLYLNLKKNKQVFALPPAKKVN